jgi:TPR repeat protein
MAVATEASSRPPPSASSQDKSKPAKAIAAGWLGRFYEEGVFVPKNLEAAFHWYQIAANAGDDILKVAKMLAKGEGTTKNTAEAIRLLKSMPDTETAELQLAEVYIFYDTATSDRYEKARHILGPLHDRGKAPYYRHPASYYTPLWSELENPWPR